MLKKDAFDYADQKVEISELSGLQRIDYISFIKEVADKYDALPEETSDSDRNIAFTTMQLRINAWLVAASLWHSDKKQNVETLQQVVLEDWSGAAIASCSQKVLALSNMIPAQVESSDTDEQLLPETKKDLTPEKP
ncbi:phage minor tail protein G [Serratia sp. AS12]|uniref:phage tail assembly chaperone G n=1 Tax=Serratia TaxID=613 RepID=UPI00020E9A7C|nr:MULTISPECIES: phage minor tail protein G [Serratia]AEF46520.1 phage minor tail protein G [Serratia plymuthica AS9]AEF51472.1 phage minor tail protein G [Serratia sp. AS12]AEG29180.1 phage minor tail protein G [Serratia sp. AS13]UTN95230.1 phage minor tail protein G [Serratia plymuthica]